MENAITYQPNTLPLEGAYDVIIAGGGTAGAAAAISALKEGLKTLVIERNSSLGGTQTNGFAVPTMFNGIPGNPLSGVDQEINTELTRLDGYERQPNNDGHFNPILMQCVLENLIVKYGGKILYNTSLVDVILSGKKIKYGVIYNNNGLQAVSATSFIDCSGDAELCRMCGVNLLGGNSEGLNQNVTLRFEMAGIDIQKYKDWTKEKNALPGGIQQYKLDLCKHGYAQEDIIHAQTFEVLGKPSCLSFNAPSLGRSNRAADTQYVSEKLIEGRQTILRMASFFCNHVGGFENAYISSIASMLGVRESRRVDAEYMLTVNDVFNYQKFHDGIAVSNYHLDAHGEKNFGMDCGTYVSKERSERYYEIPFRSLIPKGIDNLLCAGRCAGTDFLAQSTTRIQHTCRYMGEAAGIACKIAAEKQIPFREVDGKQVRKVMAGRGAVMLKKEYL